MVWGVRLELVSKYHLMVPPSPLLFCPGSQPPPGFLCHVHYSTDGYLSFLFFFPFFCQNMLMALNKYWAALTQQLFSNFFWQAPRCSEFSWSPPPPPQRLPRQGVHSNDVVPFDFHTRHWVVVKVSSSRPRGFHSSQSLAFQNNRPESPSTKTPNKLPCFHSLRRI